MIVRPKLYKNFVPPETGKAYRISSNSDGSSSITDVTAYVSEGDNWTASDANMIWDALVGNGDESIPVVAGGTGVKTLAAGSYLVGNGEGEILVKTPSEVRSDIGAAPAYTYGTSELIDGESALATGTMYLMHD